MIPAPPLPRAPADAPGQESGVEVALLRIAYDRKRINLGLTAAVALIGGGVVWRSFASTAMAAWMFAVMVSAAIGWVDCAAFQSASLPLELGRFRRRFMVQSALAGFAWSVGPALMIAEVEGARAALLVSVLACVCGVAMTSLAEQRGAMQAFIAAALLPPALAEWRSGGDTERLLALILVAGMTLLIAVGRSTHNVMRTSLETQSLLRTAMETARRRTEFLGALNETTLDLLKRREASELLQTLTERAAALFEAPNVELLLKEGPDLVVHAFTPGLNSARGMRITRNENPLSWQALDSRQTVTVADYQAFPHAPNRYDAHAPRAMMEVPILRETEGLGVLSLDRREPNRPFTPEEIGQAEMLARQAALILHSVTIYAEAVRLTEARTATLRESEQRFRTIFEANPAAIVIAALPEGPIVAASDSVSRIFGYAPEEIVGKSSFEIKAWADLRDRERYVALLRGGLVKEYEAQVRKKDGGLLSVLFSGSIVQLEGRPHSLNILLDITDRKQAEAALHESENRLAYALEATSEGLWDWTIDTGEVHFSSQWARLLGYEPEDVPQRVEFFFAILHPEDVDRVKKVLDDHLAGKTPVKTAEARLRMKSGEFLWVLDRGKVVAWDSSGNPARMVGTIADIAERRRAQDALQASLHEKEALLKEVHHRVKNNLQVVSSLLRLESGRHDNVATQAVLLSMQGRIQSMALMHESLYRSGAFAAVDLGDYLRQVAGEAFRLMNTLPGSVNLRLDLISVPVGMDQALPCGLIVSELVSNSLKHGFTSGRFGEIRITLQRVGLGPKLRLSVSDTGAGLNGNLDSTEHTLGLRLVKGLATQLGGSLEIGPGPGASFSVVFAAD